MEQVVAAAAVNSRMRLRNLVLVISALPVLAAVLANALYAIQGGISGDGPYDAVIATLTAPWSVWADYVPNSIVPAFVLRHDLLADIWLPALLNVPVFFVVAMLAARLLRARKAA